jgi:hypothetical protein
MGEHLAVIEHFVAGRSNQIIAFGPRDGSDPKCA